MNIDINLLPKELRARPAIDPKIALLIVLIGVLAGGCFYLLAMKNSAVNDTAESKQMTAQYKKDAQTLTNNPELASLKASVDALNKAVEAKKAANRHYDNFLASRVLWGDTLDRVYSSVPLGVTITSLRQSGANSLVVTGTATSYDTLTRYAVQLEEDPNLALTSLPPLSAGSFTLTVTVTPGGEQ
jgi:Tfp pilus assembly protein PilN